MKRKYLYLLILLLIALFPSCSQEFLNPDPDESVIPTGRYVEEQLALPPGLQSIKMLDRTEDGAVYLLGSTGGGWTGPWGLWVSQDDGSTWNEEKYPWVEELGSSPFVRAAATDGKTFYIMYDDNDGGCLLAKAGTGSLEPVGFPLPEGEYGLFPVELQVAEDGNLLVVDSFNIFYIDNGTGQLLQSINNTPLFFGGEASESGGMLYLAGINGILKIDLSTGGEVGTVVSSPLNYNVLDYSQAEHGRRVLAACPWDNAIYYCDDSGLYRTLEDSPVTELLLSGERSMLGLPTMVLHKLVILPEDRYLVLGNNGAEGLVIYRYVYDPDIPSEASSTLQVYSLYDDPTVRQAAGAFQRDVPTVQVNYQVGLEDQSGVTVDDALRVLSTEILAGTGPDLLILDGLPMESYVQKGILLDLSAALDVELQDGSYLDNIINAYREDGKLYAVPARFAVPMLLAPKSAENATTLEGLADWADAQDSLDLKFINAPVLLEQFYSAEYQTLFQEDGTLDEGGYIRFLENITRLSGYGDPEVTLEEIASMDNGSFVVWASDFMTIHIDELDSLFTAALANQAIIDRGDGSYHPLGNVFIPKTVLGVTANGSQQEMAIRFLETALSNQVLSNDFRNGLPVRKESLERNSTSHNPDGQIVEDFWIYLETEDAEAEMELYWPEDAFFSSFIDRLSTLDTPVHSSETMRPLIMEQSLSCLNGELSPQEAAQELKQKINLMIAEQG